MLCGMPQKGIILILNSNMLHRIHLVKNNGTF